MNFNKFQRTIILLLLSLVVSHCGCNKDKSGNNRQPTRKKGEHPELTEEQKKQKQEEQKKQKEAQEKQRQEELKNLVDEEKDLETKTKELLKQLEQLPGPTQPFFKAIQLELDDNIEKSKIDLQEIDKIVIENKEIKKDLASLEAKLKKGEAIQFGSFPLSDSIDEMITLIYENLEIKEARTNKKPINYDNLSTTEKSFYERIVNRSPLAKNDPELFLRKTILESVQNLLKATNAQLALFQNIQKQHQLKKE